MELMKSGVGDNSMHALTLILMAHYRKPFVLEYKYFQPYVECMIFTNIASIFLVKTPVYSISFVSRAYISIFYQSDESLSVYVTL